MKIDKIPDVDYKLKVKEVKLVLLTGIGYPTQDITKKHDLRVLHAINRKQQQKIGEKLRNFSYFGGTKSG